MSFTLRYSVWAGVALLTVATAVAYFPAMHGEFIWDDNTYITRSPTVTAPDALRRIWLSLDQEEYCPASNSAFWLQWRLWGLNSTGYHATSLAMHIVAALAIWALLARLSVPGAYLAALLFAVHPANVESVAWIFQQRGLLALCLALMSIHFYLQAMPGAEFWYGLSLIAFLLAMLSKGSVAILPLVLLLVAWWQRDRITRWDVFRTGPFFVLAIALTVVNIWFQTHGTGELIRSASVAQRLDGAAAAVWFYLSKGLLPINLLFVYPQWQIESNEWLWWLPLTAVVAVTVVLLWKPNTHWGRALLFGWGFFCVALLPVMGFADVYFMKFSLVADHYQYIAVIGIMALTAAFLECCLARAVGPIRVLPPIVATAVTGAFILLTWWQSATYSDAITLYQRTLAHNPGCWMAHNNLGSELDRLGQTHDAIEHYQQAVLLNPQHAEALNNLGKALSQMSRPQEAIEHLHQALRLKPDFPEAHYNLGIALASIDRPQEAIEHYQRALRLEPDDVQIHNNLGVALVTLGRPQEAIEHYQRAIRLKPDFAEAHYDLGIALSQTGQSQEAIEHYQQAIRLKPGFAEAYNNLANLLARLGRPQEAIDHYQKAIRLNPGYADAYFNLALANADIHRSEEAILAAQRAIDIANANGRIASGEQMAAWLKSYRAGQPSQPAGSAVPEALSPQK